MLAVKKGEKAPEQTPQGEREAEPYRPEDHGRKLYGPFRVNVGRHEQVDPGENRMVQISGEWHYKTTLRDRNSPPFMSDKNLAAPQHEGGFAEKFSYVGGNPNGAADETARRPGESLADFAARMTALAAADVTALTGDKSASTPGKPAGKDGPADDELRALGGMTPDEVRAFGARYGVDFGGLPKNVKRDDLVTHVRQVVKELYGRA